MSEDDRPAWAKRPLPVGTKITCPAGHVICEVVESLVADGTTFSRCFGHFRDGHYQPHRGDGVDQCVCGECGRHWIRQRTLHDSDGMLIWLSPPELHTEFGWWPSGVQN